MKPEQEIVRDFLAATSRRSFLRRASLAGAAAALAPVMGSRRAQAATDDDLPPDTGPGVDPTTVTTDPILEFDASLLNFALNLEYLEAQYYSYALTGLGIEAQGVGTDGLEGPAGQVIVKASPKVPFSNSIVADYAMEIAADEVNHVKYLRNVLQAAGGLQVAQPEIDLLNSFNALASLAGIGAAFDPFADDLSFLLGAFIFEDVGVTAYHGVSPRLSITDYRAAVAGLLAVEAYHASEIRTVLYTLSKFTGNTSIIDNALKISQLRDKVGQPGKSKDQGLEIGGKPNIVPTDANSLAYTRGANQVLRIVYGMNNGVGVTPLPGGFFPKGLNGRFK